MGSLEPEAGVPRDARERSIWVQGRLRLHASSFAAIARGLGISARAVGQAMFMPNHRVERALAAALGLEPRQLFAERYDAAGRRLHAVRMAGAASTASAADAAGAGDGPGAGSGYNAGHSAAARSGGGA